MEKEYILKSGGLKVSFYKDQGKDPITDCKMLTNWLRSHPSRDIEKFDFWKYTVNEKTLIFKLEREDENTWNVYHLELPDKVFFQFTYRMGLQLQHDFESAIIKKLKSIDYY
jgi:hypothetical protein